MLAMTNMSLLCVTVDGERRFCAIRSTAPFWTTLREKFGAQAEFNWHKRIPDDVSDMMLWGETTEISNNLANAILKEMGEHDDA